MITAYFPGATTLQMTTFLTNRPINACFWLGTGHSSGASFPAQVVLQIDEDFEDWDAIKTMIVAALQPGGLTLGGLSAARVVFPSQDVSMTGGRLADKSFNVNADGSQTV